MARPITSCWICSVRFRPPESDGRREADRRQARADGGIGNRSDPGHTVMSLMRPSAACSQNEVPPESEPSGRCQMYVLCELDDLRLVAVGHLLNRSRDPP